jgi:hypothetical protein
MALIASSVLLGIADRAAKQYEYLFDARTNLIVAGTGLFFTRASNTDDADVEIPLDAPYDEVDDDFTIDNIVKNGTLLGSIVTAMENHFSRKDSGGAYLQVGGWDGYLAAKDERVNWYFAEIYRAVKDTRMLARNVFSESDDTFATIVIASGPSITFTDGVNYGNGAATNPANGSNYAATQLKVVVGASFGASDLDLRLSVKDVNNNPTTIDVTVPASSVSGAEIDIGSSTDRFLDVIGATFVPLGSFGTLGDSVTIQNKKERTVAL